MATLAASMTRAEGLVARWQRWRDALLASPAFRRRALAFAPTRWIARRRAAALFDLVAGFVYSQTLLACVQLRLFERLRDGPMTADALAGAAGVPSATLVRLLDAAVSLQLMEHRPRSTYGLGALGAALVDNPAVQAMVEHHVALYDDLRDPVALLRGEHPGALAAYWPYAEGAAPASLAPERVAPYSALMATSQALVADEILDAWPLDRHACLMDVGGGEGGFLAAAGRRAPALRLVLFDLPAVADRARRALAGQDLAPPGALQGSAFQVLAGADPAAPKAPRVTVCGGDFFHEALPRGADVISLVRVVHDHDDAHVRILLRAVHEALPRGGVLLLAEPMADTPGARAMGEAYFGLYLLAMGGGRPRSAAALTALLHEAGFDDVRQRPTHLPLQTGLLVATRSR